MRRSRSRFGVRLTGCSGREVITFPARWAADKARRRVREWKAGGGWVGWWTLERVARGLPQDQEKEEVE